MTLDMWLVLGLFIIALFVAIAFPVNRAILKVTFKHPRKRSHIKVGQREIQVENHPVHSG